MPHWKKCLVALILKFWLKLNKSDFVKSIKIPVEIYIIRNLVDVNQKLLIRLFPEIVLNALFILHSSMVHLFV